MIDLFLAEEAKMARVLSIGACIVFIFFLFPLARGEQKALPTTTRVTKMRAGGVVTELTEKTIKIKRQVKNSEEIVEFSLEKPVEKIKVGDKVKVSYIIKNGEKVAIKVTRDIPPKTVKTTKKPEVPFSTPK